MTGTEPAWYVGCVRSCQEKQTSLLLSSRGVEHYLPLRREVRRWSDRRKVVEVPVLPRFIFIHCLNSERSELLAGIPYLCRFLSNPGSGSAAVVRDAELDSFRQMVEYGGRPVNFVQQSLAPGDRVRVVDGPLTGLECELVSVGSGRCLAVRLGLLGTATVDLELDSVEKI
ncbi:MAG: UpxY family transcription antiterminator [Bacteroidales bacterium]|nr:UpxY family transcription antiterminator [Bacteroidales bacterium]